MLVRLLSGSTGNSRGQERVLKSALGLLLHGVLAQELGHTHAK